MDSTLTIFEYAQQQQQRPRRGSALGRDDDASSETLAPSAVLQTLSSLVLSTGLELGSTITAAPGTEDLPPTESLLTFSTVEEGDPYGLDDYDLPASILPPSPRAAAGDVMSDDAPLFDHGEEEEDETDVELDNEAPEVTTSAPAATVPTIAMTFASARAISWSTWFFADSVSETQCPLQDEAADESLDELFWDDDDDHQEQEEAIIAPFVLSPTKLTPIYEEDGDSETEPEEEDDVVDSATEQHPLRKGSWPQLFASTWSIKLPQWPKSTWPMAHVRRQ